MNNLRSLFSASLLTAVGLLWTPAAQAQSYTLSTTSRTFSSIAGLGTAAGFPAGTDDDAVAVTLPFSFPFFGVSHAAGTSVYATTNGVVNFDGDTEYQNTLIPASSFPNGFIAGLWTDLTTGSGDLYYYSQGSGSSASLTFEWSNVIVRGLSSYTLSFQVILYASGVVEIVYGPYTSGISASGSVGLEDPSGASGLAASCNSACSLGGDLFSGSALVFTPSTAPPPGVDLTVTGLSSAQSSWPENGSVSFSANVSNLGTAAASGSYATVFIGSSPTVTASDIAFAEVYVPSVSASGSATAQFSFTVPSGYAGSWYYAVIADAYGDLTETNESNNAYQGGALSITSGSSGITITTATLPNASVGTFYNQQLLQSGATSPYWYVSGGSLPQGLALSSTGVISGTPSVAGTANFTVTCEQAGLTAGNASLSLTVTNGNTGTLTVTPTTLPEATVGVGFDVQLGASGGTPPYAFQIISGQPGWMAADSSGHLTGTPNEGQTFQLAVSVFDSVGLNGTASYTLTVSAPTALQLASSVPAAVTGREYSARVVSGGIPPYAINVTGNLPPGLSLDASGFLVGTPSSMGQSTVMLSVTDANTPQGSVSGTLTVQVTQLTTLMVASNDVTIYVKTDASAALEARGGVPPYRWALIEGALPTGLLFNTEEGKILGRVELTSTTTITVAVTDSEGSRAEKSLQVKVQVYRAPNNGDRNTGRDTGCGCATVPGQEERGPVGLLLLLGLIFWARGRRS